MTICKVLPSALRVSFIDSTPLGRARLPSRGVSLLMVTVYSETLPVGWISTANLENIVGFYKSGSVHLVYQ